MKKVKMLLEPAEVEMIRDALQLSYDDDCFDDDDNDVLEGLCQAFAILAMSGNFVKVAVDEETCYADECNCCSGIELPERIQVDNSDDDDNDPDAIDPDDSCWDVNDDDECSECDCDHDSCECDTDDNNCGCGVTKQDLENAWNANEPWNTDKK